MLGGLGEMADVAATINEDVSGVTSALAKGVTDIMTAVKGRPVTAAGTPVIQVSTTPAWVTPVLIGAAALVAFSFWKSGRGQGKARRARRSRR